MDLRVAVEPATAALPTCFVTLPPAIASTLVHDERVGLLVLSIQPVGRQDNEPNTSINVIYAGWDGGASRGPHFVGIQSAFATALGLEHGQRVLVKAVERGRFGFGNLDQDALRDDAPRPNALRGQQAQMVSLSVQNEADYAAVSTTAEFLEGSVLQQIRVLYPGLTFPLQLPGRRCVKLGVVSLQTAGEDQEYVLLGSGVQLTVLAPGEGAREVEWKSPLRALPTPRNLLTAYPTHILVRRGECDTPHGVQECVLDHGGQHRPSVAEEAVYVPTSIRRAAPTQPQLDPQPAMLCISEFHVDQAADSGSSLVYVPPHLWWAMGLAPLTPVVLERMPEGTCADAPSTIRILRTDQKRNNMVASQNAENGQGIMLPSISILGSFPALVFPGMVLGKCGEWIVAGRDESGDRSSLRSFHEQCEGKRALSELFDAVWSDDSDSTQFPSPSSTLLGTSVVSDQRALGSGTSRAHDSAPFPQAWKVMGRERFQVRYQPLSMPEEMGLNQENATFQSRGHPSCEHSNTGRNISLPAWPPEDSGDAPELQVLDDLRGASPRATVGYIVKHFSAPTRRTRRGKVLCNTAASSTLHAFGPAPPTLSSDELGVRPRFLILRGTEGSGRTSIGKSVARILRRNIFTTDFRMEVRQYRTIWIRCRIHKHEPTSISVARIYTAFAAAKQSQPALVVFDDLDALASTSVGQKSSGSHNMLESEKHEEAARGHAVSRAIIECLDACGPRVENCVDVLGIVGRESNLDSELLVPGVISSSVDVSALSLEDRACILAYLVEGKFLLPSTRYANIPDKLSFKGDGRTALQALWEGKTGSAVRAAVCEAAENCDGFTVRDLVFVVERAIVASHTKGHGGTDCQHYNQDMVSNSAAWIEALKTVSKGYVPRIRMGVHFSQPEEEAGTSMWDQVGGLEYAKSALREAFELPSRFPNVFSKAPVHLQTGVLLYGPPGTGKTLLASAAAKACGMRSVYVKGPELLSKYIGESEAEVRRLFERAASLAPCIIIFDEFDSLAPRRGGETTGVADRVVNTLLTSLDGVEGLAKGVFVIATSSRPELIDPAVLRPGRIDKWIGVDFPSDDDRRMIFEVLWRGMNISAVASASAGLAQLVTASEGMSGADIRGALTDAHIRSGPDSIPLDTILSAIHDARPSVSFAERNHYRAIMDSFARKEYGGHPQTPLGGKLPVRVALQ